MASIWSAGIPNVCLAHPVYGLEEELQRQGGRCITRTARSRRAVLESLAEVEAMVATANLWSPELLDHAPNLKLVQATSSGVDKFPLEELKARGIRLCSAQGVNVNAVSEHAMSLVLSLSRRLLPSARNQDQSVWGDMIADPALREQELEGRTMVILGMGRIGGRLAKLASAFDMKVIGVKRGAASPDLAHIPLVRPDQLEEVVRQADILALTCPLTPETEGLVSARVIAAMKPSAWLVNVARGKVVDEAALIAALSAGRIAGAGLDCVVEEPLPATSPLWTLPNTIVTPHSAGETQFYERNVIRLLLQNLAALENGSPLVNPIV